MIVRKEGRGPKYSVLFTRSRGALVELIAEDLGEKLTHSAAMAHSFAQEAVAKVWAGTS